MFQKVRYGRCKQDRYEEKEAVVAMMMMLTKKKKGS